MLASTFCVSLSIAFSQMYRLVSETPAIVDGRAMSLDAHFDEVMLEFGVKALGIDPVYAVLPQFSTLSANPYDSSVGMLGNKDPDAHLQGYRLVLAGLDVKLFAQLNANMTIAQVILYSNTVNDLGTATQTDVSAQLAPSGGTHTHVVGAPNVQTFFWLKTIDESGNETISNLGSKTTQDNTPPVISSATVVLDPVQPTSKLDVSFAGSDNDQIQSWYVLVTTDPAPKTAAEVKASGQALPAVSVGADVGGLEPNKLYYVWVVATDRVGLDTITATAPASITTDPDVTPPTLDSFSLTATVGAEETSVDVTVTISDVVA